ncbi:MAG: YdcF family protein [Nitrospirae bacterium YQR-1]
MQSFEDILRNIALILINPLVYLTAGLLFLTLTKKHRRFFTASLTLVFYLVFAPLSSNVFMKFWAVPDTYNPKTQYDAVVVLAGAINMEWHIREKSGKAGENIFMPVNYVRTTQQTERILAGIYFVKNGHAKKLLFGDWAASNSAGTAHEGQIISGRYFSQLLESNQYEVYGEVKRTTDEAFKMKKIAEEQKLKKILLVTSQSHMKRALAMFKKQGLSPDTFSVNKRIFVFSFDDILPKGYGLNATYESLYELSGYVIYKLTGKL